MGGGVNHTGEEKATPSDLPGGGGQKTGSVEGKATDSDADMDLIDDLELSTPGNAASLSEEAIMFIDGVEKLDKEQLLKLVADYAEAWRAYGSVAAREDVDAAELERAAAAYTAAEDALLKAYDQDALFGLYEQIPEEEKAHGSVVRAYEKLADIHDAVWQAMQEVRGVVTYAKQQGKEICFWLDSEVDNFDNLNFQIYEGQDSSKPAAFIEKGTADKGGELRQYLKYELSPNVTYTYHCQPYEYRWTSGSVTGGTPETTISLTRLPYCTVQFEVKDEDGNLVSGTVIEVANGGDPTTIITPIDADGTKYHVPVHSQSPIMLYDNYVTYNIQAAGYVPHNGNRKFTASDENQTISIPIVLYKKKTVKEVYDRNWDYTADELEIGTPEELAAYSYWSNTTKDIFKDKKIVLTDDIDISGILWEPISCYLDASQVGSFDGQGHTVTMDMVRLHMIDDGADKYYFGGLFGVVTGSSIENVNVEGSIRTSGDTVYAYVGGIAAYMADGNAMIKNCTSNVDITFSDLAAASYIGGIVGLIGAADLEQCSYDGDISIGNVNSVDIGGIAGLVEAGGIVRRVVSSGNITVNMGYADCGGIVGTIARNATGLTGCISYMNIGASSGNVGGIFASSRIGKISNVYFDGTAEYLNGDLQSAIGKLWVAGELEACGYTEGSGHNNSQLSGVTCITANMTPEEVLDALNTPGELPWFTYMAGEPTLIALPKEAVVSSALDGVKYVQEGDTVTFSVSATSPDGGTLIYQWQKDGVNLAGGDASSYTIPVVATASEGIYSVIIKNQNVREETSAGTDGGSCRLIVVKKGEIQVSSGGYQGGWTKEPVKFELSGGLSDYLFGYEYLSTGAGEKPGAADARWSLCGGALRNTVTASEQGESYYWFRTRNQAGQTGEAEGPVRVRIDRTAPDLAQPVVTENTPDTEQATIRLSASDAMSGLKEIRYLVKEAGEAEPSAEQIQAGTPCQPGEVRITGLIAGNHYRVYAAAADQAGNVSKTRFVEFQKDKTAEEPPRREESSVDDSSDTGSWVGANGSTSYIKPDGSYCRSEWYIINGQWYYFDGGGKMVTGWYYDPAYQAWFYLKPDGTMAVGWIKLNEKWYYLNPVSDGRRGAMYADAWIDGCYLGKDGAWVEEKSQ